MPKSIFSFFSGAGLLDLGFEAANFNIVFVNEYKQEFLQAYQYARRDRENDPPLYGYHQCSIDDFAAGNENQQLHLAVQQERDAGNIVGFIGGPPCPDFSVAGRNRGRNGPNGILAQSFVDLIIDVQPDFFVFENVRGLVKTKQHREYFYELKQQLRDAGYYIADKLLNALSFGVPQDRDRIILIGVHQGFENVAEHITPEGDLDFHWMDNARFGEAAKIKANMWKKTDAFVANNVRYFPRNTPNEYRDLCPETWFRNNHVQNHPNGNDYFAVKNGLVKMQTIAEGDVSRKSFKRLHRWRYSPTAAYGNNEVHLHPYMVRRLSVAEAMAIQSLPESFELPPNLSLSNKFKMIGNGVPYLMARAIAMTLNQLLENMLHD